LLLCAKELEEVMQSINTAGNDNNLKKRFILAEIDSAS